MATQTRVVPADEWDKDGKEKAPSSVGWLNLTNADGTTIASSPTKVQLFKPPKGVQDPTYYMKPDQCESLCGPHGSKWPVG